MFVVSCRLLSLDLLLCLFVVCVVLWVVRRLLLLFVIAFCHLSFVVCVYWSLRILIFVVFLSYVLYLFLLFDICFVFRLLFVVMCSVRCCLLVVVYCLVFVVCGRLCFFVPVSYYFLHCVFFVRC